MAKRGDCLKSPAPRRNDSCERAGVVDLDEPTNHYIRRTSLVIQDVDGETLLLDGEGNCIHQLNRTASFVWHLCDGKTSVEDIVRLLIREFDVDEATAAQDVASVVDKLRGLNLLWISTR